MARDADRRDDSRESRAPRDETRVETRPAEEPAPRRGFADVFASTTLRLLITVIGLIVFLFALGQAVGVDLLGMTADALATQTGQWLLVALFALLLIGVAQRAVVRRY